MNTGKRIQILLSAYNGERYLREQLDSYLSQTVFDQCCVLIRDDGSTDGTKAILDEYSLDYGFSVYYGENIGVNASFQWLIDHADADCDYFAFSDQDDVWLTNKLEFAVDLLDREDEKIPQLYASRSVIVDEDLKQTGLSQSADKGCDFYNAMVQNICPGHEQVFNREMLLQLRAHPVNKAMFYDWWVYLIAAGIGNVHIDKEQTILHRQHGKNTVGYGTTFFQLLLPRLKRLVHGDSYKMTLQLENFSRDFSQLLPADYRGELNAFLKSSDKLVSRIKYLSHCRLYRQTGLETAAFKVYYLLGRYKTCSESHISY